MSNLTTRAGKGSPLTNNELDANFTNLNADKVEVGGDLSGTATAPNVAKIQGRAVSADTPEAGEKLVWNGSAWEPSTDPTGEPIGHADKSESTVSFNSGTRTFTIAPVAASFTVWCKGVKHTYTSAQTVVIPDTTGLHFIYFDASGVLSTQMTYFTWDEHAPTAYIYWNATTQQAVYFGDERHGITLDWQTHEYLHRTRGAAIASGFGASNYTTTGAGATDADAQIDIGGGTFFDEDLQVDIVSTNTPVAGTWQQDLSGPARIPVLYLSGSAWVIDAPTDFPFKVVSGIPQYNLYSGGTWSTAPVNNNEYFVTWILATHNLTYPVVAVISQAPTNQLSAAEAMTFEGLNLSGFPSVEFRPLYKVIYTHKLGFTNSVKASTVAVYDLRSLQSAGVAAALVQDHGNLSGLIDDDHPQYLHVSTVRTPSDAVKNSFLPSQSGNSGKYLTTDGSNPSWGAIPSGSLAFTGDVTGTGNTGSSTTLTLANSGVTAGTFTKVTVDAKGRVTTGSSISSSDVTTALGFTPESAANKGIANGYASLDAGGKVPSTQLPSYVDDVLEYANLAAFPATGESGKIYIAIDTVKTYRWSGSAYVEITSSPGTTDSVTEGSTNLYFTNARARAAVSASGSLSYNVSTGIFSYTQPTNVSAFTNDSGYLTGITGTQVTTALGYTPLSTAGGTLTGGLSIGGNLNMGNFGIVGVDSLTFNDPGPNEGLNWAGGNLWRIYESPNDLTTNSGGNIQFVQNGVRRATFNTSGQLELPIATGTAPFLVASTTRVANLNVATAGTADALTTARTINGVSFDGTANITIGRLFDEGGSGSNIRLSSGNELEYYSAAGTIGTMYLNYSSADANSVRGPGGSTFINSSNYSSYALPLSGGTINGTLVVNSTSDNQITLTSSDSWTGIGFNDSAVAGTDYIWHNGGNSTFAIGGGGSNVAGKKLHVHGGMTIGSGYVSTTNPTNGLNVEGAIQQAGNQVLHAGNHTSYIDPRFWRLDTSSTQVQTAQSVIQAHSNGWDGGLALLSQDGTDKFQIHPDNNGYMYVDKNWYFTGNVHIGSIGQIALHSANYSSYALPLSGGTLSGKLTTTATSDWTWQANNGANAWSIGPSSSSFTIGDSKFLISSSGASVNSELILERGTTKLLEVLQANLQYKGNVVLHAGNYNSYALPLSGGSLTGDLNFDFSSNATVTYSDSGGVYIPRPQYAAYHTTASTQTGVLTIQLPTAAYAQSDMISFWVDVYDYNSNESVSIFVYGYAYGSSTGQWTNTGATILSPRTDRNYPVRFCHDGTRHVVCIGDVGSTWSYAQVNVRDFQAGYSVSASTWDDGWNITFLTTLPTVMATSTDNYPVAQQLSGYSRLLLTSGGNTWSSYDAYSADNNESGMRFLDSAGGWRATVYGSGSAGGFLNSTGGWDLQKNYNGELSLVVSGSTRTALHAGNYNSYALPLGGGTVTGSVSMTADAQGYAAPTLYVKGDIRAQRGTGNTGVIYFGNSSGTYLYYDGSNYYMPSGNLYVSNNLALHAGNYSSYALPLSGGTLTGLLVYSDIKWSGDQNYGLFGRNAYLDTVNGRGSDPLELNYYDGGPVKIGTGTNGSKSLYAAGIYDSGNQVLHAGNYSSYALPLSGGSLTGNLYINGSIALNYSNFSNYALPLTGGTITGDVAIGYGFNGFNNISGTEKTLYIADSNVASLYLHAVGGSGRKYILYSTASGSLSIYDANAATVRFALSTSSANFSVALQQSGNQVLHAGNYSSYAVPQSDVSTTGGASKILKSLSSGYWQPGNWIDVQATGIYSSSVNGSHFYPNQTGSYGAWRMDGSRNSYTGIYLGAGGGVVLGMYDSGGNGGAWDSSASWHFYWHRGNACFGIGSATTSASYKAYVAGALYATGNITAYSDVRKKENIVTIDGALDKVSRMRGVFYNRKDDGAKVRQVGVIAQEINEVLPEAVTYAADVDEYGVAYGNIVGVLIEAIKELRSEVAELKSKLH